MPQNLKEDTAVAEGFDPKAKELEVQQFLMKRIPVLKETKKRILDGTDFEAIMQEADTEYTPVSLIEKESTRGIYLVQDEIKGKRGSRIVPITGSEGKEWRSNISEPTLMVKIQTALSILIDQNPEAVFKAVLDKYKADTEVAKAIWKRSWGMANSKEQLKLFVFDLMKYGWAIGRTYPRLVRREGEILTELDVNNPEKNKYKKVTITEFNDIWREKLDPYRTWIDDMTNLTDPWSQDDWYFELDFSKDTFEREFSQYSNADKVIFGQKAEKTPGETDPTQETSQRTDIVTLGFYESKNKDLYSISVPAQGHMPVYFSPLPNDDKMLSCWHTYWVERDPRTPYGIGLYEIIKNNKVLYDRLENMTIDQLVMAIYPMLFYSGANQIAGDGKVIVSPGVAKQKLPGTTVEQIKVDYDNRGMEGIQFMADRIDENTGITPTLQGQVEGKTLGEVLHAKDAALKRLNIPLSNIANALQTDAYLTLSWASQIYSTPEVMEFVDEKELKEYMEEQGTSPEMYSVHNETGAVQADFPHVLDLSLKQSEDRNGNLIESPEARFFTVGKDLDKKCLSWKGKITINPTSVISPSPELERQRKMELFNLVTPVVQTISMAMSQGQFEMAVDVARPVIQILEIQNEKPEKWLSPKVVAMIDNPMLVEQATKQAQIAQNTAASLFVDQSGNPVDEGAGPGVNAEAGPSAGLPSAPSSSGPALPGVVPKDQVPSPLKNSAAGATAQRMTA